jgi:hypothetical protein
VTIDPYKMAAQAVLQQQQQQQQAQPTVAWGAPWQNTPVLSSKHLILFFFNSDNLILN